MTDSLVTKQRLEAKQLLFYSQLFQQLLAWPWLFEPSASHVPVWTATRPPSTASFHSLCFLPSPDSARSLLCGKRSTDSCSDSVPRVCGDQWPIFAFFIINYLGQGAPSICSAEGTGHCQGFLCTKGRKAVNEWSVHQLFLACEWKIDHLKNGRKHSFMLHLLRWYNTNTRYCIENTVSHS